MYINGAATFVEFRLPDVTTSIATLTSKLNELFSDTDNRNVKKIEFREDWINTNERVKCTLIELNADGDLTVMWRSFRCRLTKGSIELDSKILKSVNDIIKMSKNPESSSSVCVFLFISVFLSYVNVYLSYVTLGQMLNYVHHASKENPKCYIIKSVVHMSE